MIGRGGSQTAPLQVAGRHGDSLLREPGHDGQLTAANGTRAQDAQEMGAHWEGGFRAPLVADREGSQHLTQQRHKRCPPSLFDTRQHSRPEPTGEGAGVSRAQDGVTPHALAGPETVPSLPLTSSTDIHPPPLESTDVARGAGTDA